MADSLLTSAGMASGEPNRPVRQVRRASPVQSMSCPINTLPFPSNALRQPTTRCCRLQVQVQHLKEQLDLPELAALYSCTPINDAAKQQILELTTLVKKLSKKVPTKQVAADPRTNLTNLQALLDRHLQHVVSANMGLGNDKRVLNYRTGRFAASAKVERLTQSKEGMITAFYTYMKNPYATFSEGGDQQYPKSRDPKSLISGSIKEIAATIVGNRLRAVVV